MTARGRIACTVLTAAMLSTGAASCSKPAAADAICAACTETYSWTRIADSSGFPGSYNFPVFVVGDEMWAMHPEGAYRSRDARSWTRSPLPNSGLNPGYQEYVLLNGAVYALGTMTGNYENLHLTSRILRTRDLATWDTVATESNLPPRVFYGAVTHRGRAWLFGGYDGRTYYNDVWSSTDAVHWTRVVDRAPWSARNVDAAVVFNDRIWIIGGGVIDGERDPNPDAKREVWSSADGISWVKSPDRAGAAWGGSAIAFDGKLWLIAANRNSTFAPAVLVTDDGASWREESAPWSARGAPAVWVWNDRLYLAGGKYSVERNGRQEFIYRNDVWAMARR